MHGYRDHCIRAFFPNPQLYYPGSMNCFQFPYSQRYRQKIEEYPIQQQNSPKSPPPKYTPKLSDTAQPKLKAVEFKTISPCIFRMTYLWLKNGMSFWSYITFINRAAASGWRYENEQWIPFSVRLSEIKNYLCS